MTRPSIFKNAVKIGRMYQNYKEPNKAVEPTTIHATNPADAGFAPCMVAAHF